jgi:hypothetical protein
MVKKTGGEHVPEDWMLQNLARKFRANQHSRALKEEIKAALDSMFFISIVECLINLK